MTTSNLARRLEALERQAPDASRAASSEAAQAGATALAPEDLIFYGHCKLHRSWETLSSAERERLARISALFDPDGSALHAYQHPCPSRIPLDATPQEATAIYRQLLRAGRTR